MSIEIENVVEYEAVKYIELGKSQFSDHNFGSALMAFRLAYDRSRRNNNLEQIETCLFYIGTIYIRLNQPSNGIGFLLQIPNKNSTVLQYIGSAFKMMGDFFKSYSFYDSALKVAIADSDESLLQRAEIYYELGQLAISLKRFSKSLRHFRYASNTFLDCRKYENHVTSLINESRCWNILNDVENALSVLSVAFKSCYCIKDHFMRASLLYEVGKQYCSFGELDKYLHCLKCCLHVLDDAKVASKNNPKAVVITILVYEQMANLYQKQKRLEEAMVCFNQLLNFYENIPDKTGVGRTFCNMATVLFNQGLSKDAISSYQKSIGACHVVAPDVESVAHEGLSSIYYTYRDIRKCTKHLKMAYELAISPHRKQKLMKKIESARHQRDLGKSKRNKSLRPVYINDDTSDISGSCCLEDSHYYVKPIRPAKTVPKGLYADHHDYKQLPFKKQQENLNFKQKTGIEIAKLPQITYSISETDESVWSVSRNDPLVSRRTTDSFETPFPSDTNHSDNSSEFQSSMNTLLEKFMERNQEIEEEYEDYEVSDESSNVSNRSSGSDELVIPTYINKTQNKSYKFPSSSSIMSHKVKPLSTAEELFEEHEPSVPPPVPDRNKSRINVPNETVCKKTVLLIKLETLFGPFQCCICFSCLSTSVRNVK